MITNANGTKSFAVYLDENYARTVAAQYAKTAKRVTIVCRDGCEWVITVYHT